MNYEELKSGDVLVPRAGEDNEWRTPHLVLGFKPAGSGLVLRVEGSNRGEVATYVHVFEVPLTGPRAGQLRETTFTFAATLEYTRKCIVLEEGRG